MGIVYLIPPTTTHTAAWLYEYIKEHISTYSVLHYTPLVTVFVFVDFRFFFFLGDTTTWALANGEDRT